MKQFYSVEPKHNLTASNSKLETVEYDINTLICDEAEMLVDEDLPADEYCMAVKNKTDLIKAELMRDGIWRNEFGQPIFLYC